MFAVIPCRTASGTVMLLPGERKSVEPMTGAWHRRCAADTSSLYQVVADAPTEAAGREGSFRDEGLREGSGRQVGVHPLSYVIYTCPGRCPPFSSTWPLSVMLP